MCPSLETSVPNFLFDFFFCVLSLLECMRIYIRRFVSVICCNPIVIHTHRTKVHVQLDNSKCTGKCFKNTDRAAEFIAQSLRHGWKPELPIYAVQCQYLFSIYFIFIEFFKQDVTLKNKIK